MNSGYLAVVLPPVQRQLLPLPPKEQIRSLHDLFDKTQPISYIHIRDHAEVKNKETGLVEKTVVSNGGATIGYIVDGDTVMYAVAKCKVPDVFCRRIGRAITRGRIATGRNVSFVYIPKDAYRGEIRARLMNEYYDSLEQIIPDAHQRLY